MSTKELRSIFNTVVDGRGPPCHRVELSYVVGPDGRHGWQRLAFYGSNRDGSAFTVVRVVSPDQNPEAAAKQVAAELTG